MSEPALAARATEARADAAEGRAGHVLHVPQGPFETGYMVLAILFIAMLMLTNVIGTKLFELPVDLPLLGPFLRGVEALEAWLFPGHAVHGSLTLTAGIITYPATFLMTDIVSEIYGRRRADRMVWLGFFASLMMLGVLAVAKALPPSALWSVGERFAHVFHPDLLTTGAGGAVVAGSSAAQAAYSFTFDAPGVLLFASMSAYLCAQLVDNRLFHFWRRVTGGRHLWLRNNGSTMLSQLVDSIIVNFIFLHFYWDLPWPSIFAITLSAYAVKLVMALLDTPFCYLGVWSVWRLVMPGRPMSR